MSKSKYTLLERLVIPFKPDYVAKRAMADYAANLIEIESRMKRAQYKAADKNRLNANWNTDGRSINSYLQTELATMRNRSRWLLRNTPNAISGMNAFISYCIGIGITPISTVYDKIVKEEDGKTVIDHEENILFNDDLDDRWDEWAKNADITGTPTSPISFYDVQEMVLRKWVEDGEAFVHTVIEPDNPGVPFVCEFFEPESLDEGMRENPENKNPIIMGIELDKRTNKEVGYWIKSTLQTSAANSSNPLGTSKNKSTRYDAKNIFHIFKRLRPGQVRGIPWFHGVSEKFFQLDEYEDAELIGNKIAACMGIFIERASGVGADGDFLPQSGKSSSAAQDSDGNSLTHMQPGLIGSYPKGSNLHIVAPQKPGATFGMFAEHNDRKTGAGMEYGLSYEALTRNTSQASYAGGRLAVQRDYQVFRQIIKFMDRRFNVPFRQQWLDVAVLAGAIEADGYYTTARRTSAHNRIYWSRCEWIPPAWQYGVNPKDDISASRDAIRAGISDLSVESAFNGRDWKTTLRMQKRIKDAADRMGLTLTSDGAHSIVNGIDNSDDNSDETVAAAADDNKEK